MGISEKRQHKVKVLANKQVAPGYYKLCLKASRITGAAVPGQFVNVLISDKYEPLLRRPFGIHRVRNNSQIEILYEVVGEGTGLLSKKKPGSTLDVLGPLGNGFLLKPTPYNLNPILVAGGMGVAPLVFLAEKLREGKRQKEKGKITVLLGAQTRKKLLCEKEFKQSGCDVIIATDDGSAGLKGFVTQALEKHLLRAGRGLSTIYACGPKPMLKEVSRIARRQGIPAQVSLEEHMACGIGACFGCVVDTTDGYKRVCCEGPVFDAGEIKL